MFGRKKCQGGLKLRGLKWWLEEMEIAHTKRLSRLRFAYLGCQAISELTCLGRVQRGCYFNSRTIILHRYDYL